MLYRHRDTVFLTDSLDDQAERLIRDDADTRGLDIRKDLGIMSARREKDVINRRETPMSTVRAMFKPSDDR